MVESVEWRAKYQQLPQKPEYETYRYYGYTEIQFGQICYLKLSLWELTSRIKAETPINHKPYFRKTYRDYSEFLKEWEKVENEY